MSPIDIRPEIVLEVVRCSECGRYTAHERYVSHACSHCKALAFDGLLRKAEKRIAALKGALNRVRRDRS